MCYGNSIFQIKFFLGQDLSCGLEWGHFSLFVACELKDHPQSTTQSSKKTSLGTPPISFVFAVYNNHMAILQLAKTRLP